MTNGTNPIRPGDIISSTLMQAILDQLADLDARLKQLESQGQPQTSPVRIDSFSPSAEVASGQPLTIVGQNFVFPTVDTSGKASNIVKIDTVEVPAANFLAQSSDKQLVFLVPDVPGTPKAVTVSVRNAKGDAVPQVYRILPRSTTNVPAPQIDSVRPVDDSNAVNVIFVGKRARILGSNLGGNQATVTFLVTQTSGATKTYPAPGQAKLPVEAVDDGEIRVDVPEIAEVPAPPNGWPVIVQVLAAGNPTPDTQPVDAIRA